MVIALCGGLFESPMSGYAASAPESVLRRFLEEFGHDVVAMSSARRPSLTVPATVYHVHHFGYAAYYLALAGVGPFVFTSHNPFLVSDFEQVESRLDHALQRLVLHRADAIVALSRRERELLAERFDVDPARFAVIPNGLDLERYGPGQRAPGDSVDLLSVGQLASYKGHDYLLEAVAACVRRGLDIHLSIVSHQHELRDQYERRSRELGISDRMRFGGPLNTDELIERYRACDVYVQPSLAECFPVTVLEAMACGKPVVATDVGGVREEVGDAGIVVPPGDAPALAAAIEQLATDAGRRETLGASALDRARALYDGRLVAKSHAGLYEELVARVRRPRAGRRLAATALLAAYERRGAVASYVPERVRRR